MQANCGKWFWRLLTAAVLASLALPVAAEQKEPSQDKVAVVNGSVITRADYDRELHVAQRRFSRIDRTPSDSQLVELKKEALETLIDRELLYQATQKKGIKIDEATLDGKFKERFPDEAKFKEILSRMNLTEAGLKSQFRKGMAIREFIDQEFVQKATISDKETKDYYEKFPQFFKQPEQVKASHILIKVDPKADESQKAEARKKLGEIRQKIKKGEDFAALAKASSECPSSAKGGDLGYFSRGQMVKPFEDVAFALKPGEVSDIVETEFGFHIIKVVDKKPETTIPYEEAKNRIEQRLKNEKVQKEVRLYIDKMKKEANVERFLPEDTK
jgi:peptidyl-prolyl cis-trans isomerase C